MAAPKRTHRVLQEVPVELRCAKPYFSTRRSNTKMPPTLSPPPYKIAHEAVAIALLYYATPLPPDVPLLSQPPPMSDPSHVPECASSLSQVTELRNFFGVSCQIIFLCCNGLTVKSFLPTSRTSLTHEPVPLTTCLSHRYRSP
jgi:hypothetical protein